MMHISKSFALEDGKSVEVAGNYRESLDVPGHYTAPSFFELESITYEGIDILPAFEALPGMWQAADAIVEHMTQLCDKEWESDV